MKKGLLPLIVAISLVVPILPTSGMAQDFFGDNYIDDILGDTDPASSKREAPAATSMPKRPSFVPPKKVQPPSSEETQKLIQEDVSGQKVLSIGLITNVGDKAHYEANLATLRSVMESRNLPPNVLIGLSGIGFYATESYNYFHFRGIAMRNYTELPEPFAMVKKSPTFVLELEDGLALLEGVKSPEKYISSKNTYVNKVGGLEMSGADEGGVPDAAAPSAIQ